MAAALFVAVSTGPAGTMQESPSSRAVYHPDPKHLWNRLHEALFVRIGADGREYGRDRLEPLLWRGTKHLLHGVSHQQLLTVLDEFLKSDGDGLPNDPMKRAMLQRDLWLVFSWLESGHDDYYGFGQSPDVWRSAQERLRRPLAAAIGRLALRTGQISQLPDTYAAAVASGEFPSHYNPAEPDRPYLPPDLFETDSPWVCVGEPGELVAPMHVLQDNPFTNSAFMVFLKLPGGRAATLAYLKRLRAFDEPLSRESLPNPNVPQFPPGTEAALVARALLVASPPEPVATTLTENVQVRVYREVPAVTPRVFDGDLTTTQSFYEFILSRVRLFAGRAAGLRAVGRDEHDFLTGFSTHGIDAFDGDVSGRPMFRGFEVNPSRRMEFCVHCHSFPGVHSFNTLASFRPETRRPRALTEMSVPAVLVTAAGWKRDRPDWVTLQRLLAR